MGASFPNRQEDDPAYQKRVSKDWLEYHEAGIGTGSATESAINIAFNMFLSRFGGDLVPAEYQKDIDQEAGNYAEHGMKGKGL